MRLASVVFGVVVVLGAPVAAVAANEVGLSSDGTSWGPTLDRPLFDPNFRWVPGDKESSSFWVRNQSATAARLDIDVIGSAIESLVETGDVEVAVRVDDGSWVATRQSGRQSLATAVPVGPGERHKVTVSVRFDPASANVSQTRQWELTFEIRLTQDVGVLDDRNAVDDRDDDDDAGRDSNGWLPGIGGQPWWLLPAGASLVGLGMALVKRSKRPGAAKLDV